MSGNREVVRQAGHRYIDDLGWAVFPQWTDRDGTRKSLPMCPECRETPHRPEDCAHPACHGLYAATRDHAAFDRLMDDHPRADVLAVRTGRVSGLLVVDFDAKHDGPATHDEWGARTGLTWSFPRTRRQRTKSGGFHLAYRLPVGESVRSRNGVTALGVDVKAEGGLVVVAPSDGYRWLDDTEPPGDPSAEVLRWARESRVARGNRRAEVGPAGRRALGVVRGSDGRSTLAQVMTRGCPAGERDEFANTLAFMLRKMNLALDDAREVMREQWEQMEKPDGDEFRWEWCEYKLRKTWRDVEPDPDTREGLAWALGARDRGLAVPSGEVRQIGRKTITGPGR